MSCRYSTELKMKVHHLHVYWCHVVEIIVEKFAICYSQTCLRESSLCLLLETKQIALLCL